MFDLLFDKLIASSLYVSFEVVAAAESTSKLLVFDADADADAADLLCLDMGKKADIMPS